jgi:hypothetical protein
MITKTAVADQLHTAGDRLHALARKIDPPELGVRIMWDDGYRSEGSYALGSDAEDAAAVAEETAKLESGDYIVVGMVAVERDRRTGEVRESDAPHASLWGIVTDWRDAPDFEGKTLDVFDLDTLRGYLRETADEIISEARP